MNHIQVILDLGSPWDPKVVTGSERRPRIPKSRPTPPVPKAGQSELDSVLEKSWNPGTY